MISEIGLQRAYLKEWNTDKYFPRWTQSSPERERLNPVKSTREVYTFGNSAHNKLLFVKFVEYLPLNWCVRGHETTDIK